MNQEINAHNFQIDEMNAQADNINNEMLDIKGRHRNILGN